MDTPAFTFSTAYPIQVHTRPTVEPTADWTEFDLGEGIYHIPAGVEISVRVHNIDDSDLAHLVQDLTGVTALTYLNLSENRKVTDSGLKALKALPHLTRLNLSSCSLTSEGMPHLVPLSRLEYLDISYCNRLTDAALKSIRQLPRLTYLDVQGCVKLTHAGLARMRRPNLTIHR